PATLTVREPVVITQHPASRTVCAGEDWTFQVTAGGNPAPSYQWRLNGNAIPRATGSSHTVSGAQTNQAGSYDVVVSNPCLSLTSSVASLVVHVAPTIVQPPDG